MTDAFAITTLKASPFQLSITRRDCVVATAACTIHGPTYRVEELTFQSRVDEEVYEQVIDLLETTTLANGGRRLVICSSSRRLRRALRLLGYAPHASRRRVCFVRTLDDRGDRRASDPAAEVAWERDAIQNR
jgi:hypothetical protein